MSPDGLPGTSTAISNPSGAYPDSSGGLLFSDTGTGALRLYNGSAGGVISTLTGTLGVTGTTGSLLKAPRSVRPYRGGWLITDFGANAVRLLLPNGTLLTSVGLLGTSGSTGDGGLGALTSPRSKVNVRCD